MTAVAHELWLDSKQFQLPVDKEVEIELRNGENFKGVNLSYFDNRIKQFFWFQNDVRQEVKSRPGDVPAMSTEIDSEGLIIVVYESTPSSLVYNSWAKFTNFIRHKNFLNAEQLHADRGLPKKGFKEKYYRFSKALVGRGHSKGRDRNFGLKLEFIAKTNPYVDALEVGFIAQLLYLQKPHTNAQVTVFERDAKGNVTVFYEKTDATGKVFIPVKTGFDYLLDSVVLREVEPKVPGDPVWKSFWAAMTFAVPEK